MKGRGFSLNPQGQYVAGQSLKYLGKFVYNAAQSALDGLHPRAYQQQRDFNYHYNFHN